MFKKAKKAGPTGGSGANVKPLNKKTLNKTEKNTYGKKAKAIKKK